jgi:CRISPR/Cas system-associated endonuclease/helicase Cas3
MNDIEDKYDIKDIKDKFNDGEGGTIASTSLIEASIDLDLI